MPPKRAAVHIECKCKTRRSSYNVAYRFKLLSIYVISLLVLRAGYGIWLYQFLIWLYQFLIIAYFVTLKTAKLRIKKKIKKKKKKKKKKNLLKNGGSLLEADVKSLADVVWNKFSDGLLLTHKNGVLWNCWRLKGIFSLRYTRVVIIWVRPDIGFSSHRSALEQHG